VVNGLPGKERDGEKGLDYFGARYYSGAQGRFTSPDLPLIDQDPADPQSWNLYTYARNNPLKYVDTTGRAIELVGDEEERRKQLQALQSAVGSRAGSYLYENKIERGNKDGSTTTQYYLGVLSGGPTGEGPDFGSLNTAAGYLAGVIGDQQVAQVRLVDAGESFTYFSPTQKRTALDASMVGLTSPFHEPAPIKVWALDPAFTYGDLPGRAMSNGLPGSRALPDNLMHELGHAAWQMDIKAGRRVSPDPAGDRRAVDFENAVRLRRGGATRRVH
jgi:RHS repeat-associated protein